MLDSTGDSMLEDFRIYTGYFLTLFHNVKHAWNIFNSIDCHRFSIDRKETPRICRSGYRGYFPYLRLFSPNSPCTVVSRLWKDYQCARPEYIKGGSLP
jgi:hypothetical protein